MLHVGIAVPMDRIRKSFYYFKEHVMTFNSLTRAAVLSLGLLTSAVWAHTETDTIPSDQLINTYLDISRAKEINDISIEGMLDEYQKAFALSPEQLDQARAALNRSIGWDNIKPEIIVQIRKNYSASALNSYITYSKTAEGTLFNAQSVPFNREIARIYAEKGLPQQNPQVPSQPAAKGESTPITTSSPLKANDELIASDVVEHHVNNKTYFTGIVHNQGKKAAHAEVEIDLFQGNTFVDQYTTYVSGMVEPNGTRYFKVGCSCDATPATHDSIKTLINVSEY